MTKRTVLIIDDSPVSRKILRSCLPRDREYVLHEAADGGAGLELYQQHRPEVTFLDLTMPTMSGFTCLRKIRELDPKAIVVVATADVQARSRELVTSLGALTIVRKPPTKESVAEAFGLAERALEASHGG